MNIFAVGQGDIQVRVSHTGSRYETCHVPDLYIMNMAVASPVSGLQIN